MATQPDTAVVASDAPAEDVTADNSTTLYPDDQAPALEGGDPSDEVEVEGGEEASPETDEQEAPEPEQPAIDAPNSWKAEEKEAWASLPRNMQETIARRESERERFVQSKAQEAAQTRQTVERQAYEELASIRAEQAQALQRYAQMFEPQQPDIRLLQSGDEQQRALYYRQDAEYRTFAAHREEANRQAQEAATQAEAAQDEVTRREAAADHQILSEAIPEWSDPSARTNLLSDLQSIGAELGYSPELMAQARAADILALKKASEWKAKADERDRLMSQRMSAVAKAKQLPTQQARAGVVQQRQAAPVDPLKLRYPND